MATQARERTSDLAGAIAAGWLVRQFGSRVVIVSQQSARCMAAYLYTSAGRGESTTDMAWDGQASAKLW